MTDNPIAAALRAVAREMLAEQAKLIIEADGSGFPTNAQLRISANITGQIRQAFQRLAAAVEQEARGHD